MPENFEFGNPKVNALPGASCCGKPRGCSNRSEGCVYRDHPWKRAVYDNDPTVRCQKSTPDGGQCILLNAHDGPCDLPLTPESTSRPEG